MKKVWFAIIICVAVGAAVGMAVRPLPLGAQAANSHITVSGTMDAIRLETWNSAVRINDNTFVVMGRGGGGVYRLQGDVVKRIGAVSAP